MVFVNNTLNNNILLHIDTTNEGNGIQFLNEAKTHFKIVLNEAINLPKNQHSRLLLSLYSASIPISWYNIRENDNNKLYYKYNDIIHILTITPGNYTAISLKSTIQTLLNSVGGINYTVNYFPISNKFIIIPDNIIGTPELLFSGKEHVCHIQLGFIKSKNYIIPLAGLISENSISMYDKFSIYIRSNLINNTNYLNNIKTNIIERLNVKSFNTLAYYEATPLQNKYILDNNINEFEIMLTFEDPSHFINLNGLPFQVSFLINYISDLKSILPDKFQQQKSDLISQMLEQLNETQQNEVIPEQTEELQG